MKDLTFSTLIAVFEEIFGRGLFWVMVSAAAIITTPSTTAISVQRLAGLRRGRNGGRCAKAS